MELQLLDVDAIHPSPHNPRKDFPKEKMQQLSASIALQGVQQPVKVRKTPKGFELIFGERRWRSSVTAGLKKIPALVEVMDDLQVAEVQLAENLEREDLAPLEVAGGYRRLLDLGQSMDKVCERAGRKRTAVYATLQLLQLGPEARKSLGEEKISASVAQLVARVPKALQARALSVVEGGQYRGPMSYRDAEKQLGQLFTVDLRKAPFDLKSEAIPCFAKSCAVCPKRAGNAVDLYPDIKNPDTCTDYPLYRQKLNADAKVTVEAKGYRLLPQADYVAEKLFYNQGRGGLVPEHGFIDPAEACYDDTQNRPYRDLLPVEQMKKLVKVALDVDGKPHQLLERAGLMQAVKKAGVFKPRKKNAPRTSSSSTRSSPASTKPARPPPPDIDELTDFAIIGKLVAAVEKKCLTPAIVELIATELLGNAYNISRRRGLSDLRYSGVSEQHAAKLMSKATPGELAGLLFEAAFDSRFENGDDVGALCKELKVDPKATRLEVEKANAITWKDAGKKGSAGTGHYRGERYTIIKSGKGFELKYTPTLGGQKGIAKTFEFKTLELAKKDALEHEVAMKKGGAR